MSYSETICNLLKEASASSRLFRGPFHELVSEVRFTSSSQRAPSHDQRDSQQLGGLLDNFVVSCHSLTKSHHTLSSGSF